MTSVLAKRCAGLILAGLIFAGLTSATLANEAEPPPPERNPLELPTLIVATPAEGFQLALKLARLGVSQTQHDRTVLKEGRKRYANDPAQLIQASQTVAIHFQTVAQANDYWRDRQP